MTDTPQLIEFVAQLKTLIPLADEFHNVNHLISDGQELLFISPDKLVVDALDIMREKHYSQLPVFAGNRVLGVFSYRSFAEKFREVSSNSDKPDLNQLRVLEFIEKAHFVQIADDIEQILSPLNENDYLLVGQVERVFGVITTSDLARYFYKYAAILMLFGEIELTIRKIIRACVDDQKLVEFTHITLGGIYSEANLPKSVQEMTLSDYAQLIGDGRCYSHFEKIFGSGTWQRKRTRSKLEEIRTLRNDAFHFKRQMTTKDIDNLLEYRDWLKNLTIAFEAQNTGVTK